MKLWERKITSMTLFGVKEEKEAEARKLILLYQQNTKTSICMPKNATLESGTPHAAPIAKAL